MCIKVEFEWNYLVRSCLFFAYLLWGRKQWPEIKQGKPHFGSQTPLIIQSTNALQSVIYFDEFLLLNLDFLPKRFQFPKYKESGEWDPNRNQRSKTPNKIEKNTIQTENVELFFGKMGYKQRFFFPFLSAPSYQNLWNREGLTHLLPQTPKYNDLPANNCIQNLPDIFRYFTF